MTTTRRIGFALPGTVALALALVLAGCGSGSSGPGGSASPSSASPSSSSGSPTSSATTSPSATSSVSPSASVPAGFGYGPVDLPPRGPTPGMPVLLASVRVYSAGSTDRVELVFQGPRPDCRVEYVTPPIVADPSGATVPVAGQAFLGLRFGGASGYDLTTDPVVQTYRGPKRVVGATDNVTEAVLTGDFEAVLNWAVGLRHKAPFAVSATTASGRTVVTVLVLR